MAVKYDCFRPGQTWLDTNGNRIHAHGGSVIYIDGTYYWYGENKEKTDGKSDIWHWGVRGKICTTGRIWDSLSRRSQTIRLRRCTLPSAWTGRTSSTMRKRGNMCAG